MSKKLILFDVDGTLVIGSKVHDQSFCEAFKEIFDIAVNTDYVDRPGKTDKRIIIEVLNEKGVLDGQIRNNLQRIYDIMIEYCRRNINSDPTLELIPYVKNLLESLKNRGYIIIGLLTGNLEEMAKLKLAKVGLIDFFKVGGFGGLSEVRSELVEEAIKNTEEKFSIQLRRKDVFVVGDTPLDIECGKATGVKTIAISTGPYSERELKKYNPDYLFKDFSNVNLIIEAIESS